MLNPFGLNLQRQRVTVGVVRVRVAAKCSRAAGNLSFPFECKS